jgi:hypothetical protein
VSKRGEIAPREGGREGERGLCERIFQHILELLCQRFLTVASPPTTSTHTRAHRHTSSSLDPCSSIERGTICLKTTSACVLTDDAMRPWLIEVSSTHTPHTSRLRVAHTHRPHINPFTNTRQRVDGSSPSKRTSMDACVFFRHSTCGWAAWGWADSASQNTLCQCSPPIPAFPYHLTAQTTHTHTHTHTHTCTHTEGST